MSISFWEVRERLDHLLLGPAGFPAPSVSLHMLRVLLEHTWYSTDQVGWVNRKVTAQKTLGKLVGVSERTVKTALADLESAGAVARYRHDEKGRHFPDDIYMSILELWFAELR